MAYPRLLLTFIIAFHIYGVEMQGADIAYPELAALVEDKAVQLFDVREESELQETGWIPTAKNIPLAEFKNALQLSAEEFYNTYNRTKPSIDDTNFVVYCRSGRRSTLAQEAAVELGYHKIRNYRGSWLDWVANNGDVEH